MPLANALDVYAALHPDEADTVALARSVLRSGNPSDRKRPQHQFTGSALVISEDASQTLLIRHKFLQRWLPPGGHIDAGETPWQAAQREMDEETGVSGARRHAQHAAYQQAPFDIDVQAIPARDIKQEPAHHHIDWLYVMIADHTLPLARQQSEVDDVAWVAIAELSNILTARVLAKLPQWLESSSA